MKHLDFGGFTPPTTQMQYSVSQKLFREFPRSCSDIINTVKITQKCRVKHDRKQSLSIWSSNPIIHENLRMASSLRETWRSHVLILSQFTQSIAINVFLTCLVQLSMVPCDLSCQYPHTQDGQHSLRGPHEDQYQMHVAV